MLEVGRRMRKTISCKESGDKEQENNEVTKAVIKQERVCIQSLEGISDLSSRGYGTLDNGKLSLSPYEALYLLSKSIIEIRDEETGGNVDFHELLQRYRSDSENAWVRYMIYRDLRSRGYVAREGFGLGIDFRVYKRGEYGKSAAEYLVFGIQEGQPVVVEDLARTLTYAQSSKKNLIFSVLNRRGEVVYYSLSRLTFK